jgi:surface polysaccharide O-acyltransferase-like enzyme
MNAKRYNSIDLWKLIMAFCVVALHTIKLEQSKLTIINELNDSFVNMAVPFFFIASGFLLAKKLQLPLHKEENIDIIKNYLIRIVKLYLIWNIIYLPLAIIGFILEKSTPLMSIYLYLRGLFLVGQQYNSWPLWYLLSTIYSLLFIIFLLKRKQSLKTITIIGAILFLLGIGLTYISDYTGQEVMIINVIKRILSLTISSGRIFSGMFYIPMGMMFSKKSLTSSYCWILLLAGYIINVLITQPHISSILISLSSIGLFGIVSSISFKDSIVYPFIRKMSTVIYFIHMYVWSIYYKLIYNHKTFGLDSFFVTAIISSMIAIVYLLLKKRYKSKVT